MAYKNKIYVSMDADNDLHYYYLMKSWMANENIEFDFNDVHEINNIRDVSEKSIKDGLQERFRNSKVFILLVGESTRYLYKFVRWEIEQAIKRDLPCIIVNLNGVRIQDDLKCPPIIKENLSIHISFNSKIIKYALDNWPNSHKEKKKAGINSTYHYVEDVYEKLGIEI